MATRELTVHLVGSIPVEDAEAAFRAAGGELGRYLRRIPDGETGKRHLWVGMIRALLERHPDFEVDPGTPAFRMKLWNGEVHREIRRLRFKAGVAPDAVRLDTGYAQMAIESFATFQRLQAAGVLPGGLRFQVAIPTALAPACNYIVPRERKVFAQVLLRHLAEEVAKLAAALPGERLAVQWDVLQEVLLWEGYFEDRPDDYREWTLDTLAAAGNAVPRPVELGYHLCYGSPKDEHLVQPKDARLMVDLVNALLPRLRRPLDFLHLPVPKHRTDDAYYAPLASLGLPPQTQLYLGLVHHGDDAGNRERLARALRHVALAGVATECGWGRGSPERVPGILQAHRRLLESTQALAPQGPAVSSLVLETPSADRP
ncbi:MAG: hypothetical protein IT514_14225 [Burkholderiales bacterium]|nr:hypothetical protein [Burkholderiales bacterium]